MPTWLIRGGRHGEYEQRFIDENRIYLTWDGLDVDLRGLEDRARLADALTVRFPEVKSRAIANWVSQIWPFGHDMQVGDRVVVPLKTQRAIQIGEIRGGYEFSAKAENPYFHWREVQWIGEAVPRAHFGKDLLASFGALMTICRVQRNNVEARIEAMRANGWRAERQAQMTRPDAPAESKVDGEEDTDLEEAARDRIARLIMAQFKGHGLTRLVEGILKAQGYVTYRSPEGADGGADILAGSGPLGFGAPRLCVEVKSEDSPSDRPTVDKLLGAVTKFGAQEGLFVSWGGYRKNVRKELASSFFRVRLWSQADLLEALFDHYEALDEELKAELPLKRIWTVATQGDSVS